MKKELNKALSGKKIDEVTLFREMANQFKSSCKCTYVQEVHGKKGWVDFNSIFYGSIKTVELGDLLLFTYDKYNRELRICTMQAKYRKGKFKFFLSCNANLYQWELLLSKPNIINKSCNNFPPNILNFRKDYYSITAYGIFYHDTYSNDIDFLYTIPHNFRPANCPFYPISTKSGSKSFHFACPIGLSGSMHCMSGIPYKEAISTCFMDVFENQVLQCKVGAPIDDNDEIKKWALNLLAKMRESADNPDVINTILENYEFSFQETDFQNSEYFVPTSLVVVTDSSKYKNYGIDIYPKCNIL